MLTNKYAETVIMCLERATFGIRKMAKINVYLQLLKKY